MSSPSFLTPPSNLNLSQLQQRPSEFPLQASENFSSKFAPKVQKCTKEIGLVEQEDTGGGSTRPLWRICFGSFQPSGVSCHRGASKGADASQPAAAVHSSYPQDSGADLPNCDLVKSDWATQMQPTALSSFVSKFFIPRLNYFA